MQSDRLTCLLTSSCSHPSAVARLALAAVVHPGTQGRSKRAARHSTASDRVEQSMARHGTSKGQNKTIHNRLSFSVLGPPLLCLLPSSALPSRLSRAAPLRSVTGHGVPSPPRTSLPARPRILSGGGECYPSTSDR